MGWHHLEHPEGKNIIIIIRRIVIYIYIYVSVTIKTYTHIDI